ncbi:MAG: hypothetical protein AB7L92_07120, partial [Alphaproteobacteria bacterium]
MRATISALLATTLFIASTASANAQTFSFPGVDHQVIVAELPETVYPLNDEILVVFHGSYFDGGKRYYKFSCHWRTPHGSVTSVYTPIEVPPEGRTDRNGRRIGHFKQ